MLRVELHHKLHDERRYASLDELQAAITQDTADARAWWTGRAAVAKASPGAYT